MAKWFLAPALEQLRKQVNSFAPKRSKRDDGTIGDTAHASRTSDHNPLRSGAVTAWDCTHDPKGGCDSYKLAETLRTNKDPRIEYVISAGKIFSSTGKQQWQWRPYSGKNAHRQHVHVSVHGSAGIYSIADPWNIDGGPLTSAPPDVTPPTLWKGASGEAVKNLQVLLGLTPPDGKFGPATEKAVRKFQKDNGLTVDGVAGVNTWLALLTP